MEMSKSLVIVESPPRRRRSGSIWQRRMSAGVYWSYHGPAQDDIGLELEKRTFEPNDDRLSGKEKLVEH